MNCGGQPLEDQAALEGGLHLVMCPKCGKKTRRYPDRAGAALAWNRSQRDLIMRGRRP
jgi:hypothetical protein